MAGEAGNKLLVDRPDPPGEVAGGEALGVGPLVRHPGGPAGQQGQLLLEAGLVLGHLVDGIIVVGTVGGCGGGTVLSGPAGRSALLGDGAGHDCHLAIGIGHRHAPLAPPTGRLDGRDGQPPDAEAGRGVPQIADAIALEVDAAGVLVAGLVLGQQGGG